MIIGSTRAQKSFWLGIFLFADGKDALTEQLTIVMVAMHTSPLAQPGQGDAGGLNVYVRNLSQALIRQGHQVLAFTRKTSGPEIPVVVDAATGSEVIPIAAGGYKLPKEALSSLTTQFAQLMIREVTNRAKHRVVLHSHYWLSGLAAIEVAHGLQAPVIHTMHTLGAAKNSSAPGSEPAHRVERENYIAAKVSVLTANTAAEKEELIQHTGVAPHRVVVVPPGVDHHIFTPQGPTVWPGRQAHKGSRVLFAGRMQPFKGPHVLVEALAELRRRGHATLPTVHFTGAVSGQQDYDVHARAYLLGVARYCSFSRPVSPTVLASYMRAADVVAVPSVSESFGLVAVEAQACGTPVLAHRAGGLTTAVADQQTGELLNSLAPETWADALESVMLQPATWRTYGDDAVHHAATFSWTGMAQSMLRLYSTAARDRPRCD